MKQMALAAGLDSANKHFTNHSVRKTTVRKLQKAGILNDKIAAITGHRSLVDYAETDLEDHFKISKILSRPNRVPQTESSTCTPTTLLPHSTHTHPSPISSVQLY